MKDDEQSEDLQLKSTENGRKPGFKVEGVYTA